MKFFITLIILLLGGFASQYFLPLPWWSIVAWAALVGAWTSFPAWKNFLLGFLALSLLWGGYAWWLHQAGSGILTERMAKLFDLNYPAALLGVTALLGGILGGLGCLTGGLGAHMFRPKDKA